MVLATVFVLLRMVSRIGIVKRVTLDDYFMMLAWVSFVLQRDIGKGLTSIGHRFWSVFCHLLWHKVWSWTASSGYTYRVELGAEEI